MAAIRSYVNGAGGSSGADLAVLKPTYQSGNYWYVGNAVATADDANDGDERKYPFATLAAGYAAAADGDTVVVLANHLEIIATTVTIAKRGLSLLGEGLGTAKPRFVNGVAAATAAMWSVTVQEVLVDNFFFPASSVVARERIDVSGATAQGMFRNLEFECGENDATRSMRLASAISMVGYNLRFTAVGAEAGPGLEISTVPGISIDKLTFDGGSFGWATQAMYGSTACTNMRLTRVYQYNGSHFLFPTGTTGTVNVVDATGDSRIDWTP